MSYYNGSSYTFTWDGRRLASVEKGLFYATFTYNDEGLRLSTTINGATTTYLYDGSVLIAEYAPNYTCVYIYDESGAIIGVKYISTAENSTWQTYFFEKNLQGDVIAVYSDTGTKLISYRYDAWGNATTTYHNGGANTLAANNPIRYRGYYYDAALQMYYLQSRYYDPNTCRFISPDNAAVLTATPMALTDKNLYAYCDNNPVMRVDEDGEFWNILIGAGIGTLVGAAVSIISQLIDDEAPAINSGEFWAHVGVAALGGAISGGLAASGVGIIGQIGVNALIGGGSGLLNVHIEDVCSDKVITAGTYVWAALDGTLMGGISGAIGGSGSASKHVSNSFWRMVSSGGKNLSYYFSQINTQAKRDGIKAISSIFKATIPSVIDSVVDFLNQPVR